MRFSDLLAASLVAPLVAAHGGIEGAPKVFGLPKHLRARNPFGSYHAPRHAQPHNAFHARQSSDGRCGTQGSNQVCPAGYCCSPEGYCGTDQEACQAPDCQIDFGPACDANQTPDGASTRNDARPQLGNVAYGGAGIYSCEDPNHVALTFDDGPYIYTAEILDLFLARGAKATFFVTGNNLGKGAIDKSWTGVIQRMISEGHQVASHTWSHQDLDNITESQVYDQMVKNEMAIRNILGKYPTYMRPPYSACGSVCQNVMSTLGYVVTYFDLDTDDYDQDAPDKIQVAKDNFKNGIDARNVAPADGDKLVIAHDIHEQTAHNLTAYMLDYLTAQGLTTVTVGECLGDPEANWYRASTPAPPTSSSSTSSAPVPTPTGPTSTDGTCAGIKGQSCVGYTLSNGLLAECCSPYGYCGNTDSYCGTGCQAGFGKCGVQPISSVSVSATSTGPVPSPTGPTSTDGSCAGTKGQSCIGYLGNDGLLSECCSPYGYCGHTSDYCGTGCQAGFGKCGLSSSSSSMSMSSTSMSASSGSSSTVSSTARTSSSVSSSSVRTSSSSATRSSTMPSVSSTATRSSTVTSSVRTSSTGSSSTHATSSGTSSVRPTSSTVTRSSTVTSSTRASSSGTSSVRSTSSSATHVSVTTSSARASSSPASSIHSSSVSVPSFSVAPTNHATSASSYAASSFYTAVKPSSTIGKSYAVSPSPSAKVSKDGMCGSNNGGQTCAGYKNAGGAANECCCKDSGRCSNDSWACGNGCNKEFGNCWGYY